jgi:outer membrane lipoprotein-sorting protein
MVLKDGTSSTLGRIFLKGDKMRQEFQDADGHTVTIVRRDKRVLWVLLPRERCYTEIPLNSRTKLPGQFLQIPSEALHRRKTGQEKVAGYDTETYEVLVPGGERGTLRQCYWLAPKLGLPLKMTCPEKQVSVEYRNIKEESLPDRLFEIPPGFRKTDQPVMKQ